MAARTLRPMHQEDVKLKIQTTQLVNRLQDHALKKINLEVSQIRAIEILLARTLPTLTATELTQVDPADKLSESDLLAQLSALIEQHPDLVQQALAAKARKDANVPRETSLCDAPSLTYEVSTDNAKTGTGAK